MADTNSNGPSPLPDPETLLIMGIGAGLGAIVALAIQHLGRDIGPKIPSPAPVAALYKALSERIR